MQTMIARSRSQLSHSLLRSLPLAAAALLAACADRAPVAPRQPTTSPRFAASAAAERERTIAAVRRATARYHDLNAALADGFVFLSGCETRGDEGPVGIMYVHMGRLMDGVLDPALPDALIYAPSRNGRPKLAAAELAVPYPLWTGSQPPALFGTEFQREDEFGVFGLHLWVWMNNSEGMFAETNPKVSCGAE